MPARPDRPGSPGGLWSNHDFLRLWAAQAISALGSRLTRTALPVIAILSLGSDPTGVAFLSASSVAPGILVGLFAGGLVDRSRKRPLLVAADLVRAALILSVPAAAWLGALTLGHLYVVAALVGAATSLFQIADNAYLPAFVGQDHLVEANAKLEGTEAAAEIAGPAAAGVLIQLLTAPITMVADAVSYVVSALLLGRIRAPETPAAADPGTGAGRGSLIEDLRVGLRHGLGHPVVGPTFLCLAIEVFFAGFFFALYMIYTLNVLRLTPAAVGMIIGVGGVGALGGSFITGLLGRRLGVGPAMILSAFLSQAGCLFIPLAASLGRLSIPSLVLHQLLGDGFFMAFSIHAVSARQSMLPLHVLGRVNATLHIIAGVLLPVGTLIAGWLAERIGVERTVWIGVIGGLTAPLPLLRREVWNMKPP
jgi:MFS family permease